MEGVVQVGRGRRYKWEREVCGTGGKEMRVEVQGDEG